MASSEYRYTFDRPPNLTGDLVVKLTAQGQTGVLTASGRSPVTLDDGVIPAGQKSLKKKNGASYDAYMGPGKVAGTDPAGGVVVLTVLGVRGVLARETFEPVETAPGVVDIDQLIRSGKSVTATPEQLQSLTAMLTTGQQQQTQTAQALADIAQTQAELEQTRIATEQARQAALAAGVTSPDYVSGTTADPVAGRVTGDVGSRMTSGGDVQMLRWDGTAWQPLGAPLLGIGGLRAREGLNLLDYAHLVNGDDWQSALAAMVAAANWGDTIRIPKGEYTIRSPWWIDKALHFECRGAQLIARGAAFASATTRAGLLNVLTAVDAGGVLVSQPVENVAPAMGFRTTAGTGLFGDNAAVGRRHTITGRLPHLSRFGENTDANWRDGSVGLYISGAFFMEATTGAIASFHVGRFYDAKNTSGNQTWSGTTYLNIESQRLENHWNEFYNGRIAAQGYLTSNVSYHTSYGSPQGEAGKTYAADHAHIVCVGAGGENNNNVWYAPKFEGAVRRAVILVGKNHAHAFHDGRWELPYAPQAMLLLKNTAGRPYFPYVTPGHGWDLSRIEDQTGTGSFLYTAFGTHEAFVEYYDGVARVRAPAGKNNVVAKTFNWYLDGPQASRVYTYTGTETAANPLMIDVGTHRNIVISIDPGATVGAGTIALGHEPTFAYDLQITLRQASGGNAIDPQFLARTPDYTYDNPYNFTTKPAPTGLAAVSLKYGSLPLPASRGNGSDTYTITGAASGILLETERFVSRHMSRNYSGGSLSPATTSAYGTVKRAAALTAAAPASTTLTVSNPPTQAEVQAIVTRLEQVRARLADAEAKLQAAGILT